VAVTHQDDRRAVAVYKARYLAVGIAFLFHVPGDYPPGINELLLAGGALN
jgi:hypothetical protein